MPHYIQTGMRRDFKSKDIWEMHRLRTRVFKERMGWEIPILSGMEIDGYDAIDPYYVMVRGKENKVCGCMRILPSMGPYMLKDTFPELLYGGSPPEADNIWELSRFAIEAEAVNGFGFADITLEVIREIFRFGNAKGITDFVTVTTTGIERLLRRTGVQISRYGPPVKIGVEKVVALTLKVNEETRMALFGSEVEAA
ncbi:MAG: acyl-homoserine-lactone synthase [Azovibrio sp.]